MKTRGTTDIYLDANATTRVLPRAATEAHDAMQELFGNPSSSHITGIRARYILESARSLVRSVLGAPTGRIIFTSGATEAIQTAVFSTLCQIRQEHQRGAVPGERRVLLYGATEHKAVPQALAHWNQTLGIGDELIAIPVDRRGMLDLQFLREHAAAADMVCTMAVNNETGVIHDLAAIERTLRDVNPTVAWMVDCVQAIGKVDIVLEKTTIDYAAVSGHKIHAPKGIGLLYVRDGAPLTPMFAGGGQESGARSGTENLPGVAALATVFQCLHGDRPSSFHGRPTLYTYRDRLVASLRRAFPSIVFNTPFNDSVATTINFSVKGFTSKEILDLFDAAGIRVSSGSACGSALQGSYVLDAMGLPKWRSEGAIRLSFGLTITEAEIATACRRIEEAGQALCNSCLIVSDDLDVSGNRTLDGLIQWKKGSTCSWVLLDAATNQCLVVDPIEDLAERIETLIRCQGSRVIAILDTHHHVDHVSCREMLVNLLDRHIAFAADRTDALGWPESVDGMAELGDGSQAAFLRCGQQVILRTPLPGHTVDGVAYLVGTVSKTGEAPPDGIRFAFTGDTLQIGGIGRSDFASSSTEQLYHSLRRLPHIVGAATVLCPTHDYTNGFATTLETERTQNSLLASVLDPSAPLPLEQFYQQKSAIDAEIDHPTDCELVCGLIHQFTTDQSSIDIRPEEMREFFRRHRDSLIIDVREPHEFQFTQDWSSLGMEHPPENVPLTRFSDFLQRLLGQRRSQPQRDIIFVCRSGNRSGKAAEVLRRLGFHNAWHIAGGIALGGLPWEPAPADDIEDVDYVI